MSNGARFPYEAALQGGTADMVERYFAEQEGVEAVAPLVEGAVALAEHITDEMAQVQPPPRPLACAEGCSHCCHGIEVHVSPLEILRIVEHVAEAFDIADIEALLARALQTQEAKERIDANAATPTNFACPFLHDGACLAYAARPLTCRAFNSYDADACKRRKIDGDTAQVIEGYVHPHRISLAVHHGIQEGLARSNLDGHLLDLTPALLIGLTDPEARPRWLAGETAFAQAYIRLNISR